MSGSVLGTKRPENIIPAVVNNPEDMTRTLERIFRHYDDIMVNLQTEVTSLQESVTELTTNLASLQATVEANHP